MIQVRRTLISWCILGLISSGAQASYTQSSLSLDEVLDSAVHFYPLIIAAEKDVEKAQGDYLSNRGGFDPVLRVTNFNSPVGYYNNNYLDITLEQPTSLWGTKVYGGWRTGQGNFPLYDGKMATFTGGEIRGGIEVPILRNGAIDERRGKIQTSEKGVEIASASFSLQKVEIIRLASHKYWDWVAAGRKLAIAIELLSNAEVRDKALLHRVKHGDAPLIEQTENQRAVIQRQSALLAAERALQKATLELSLYLRDSAGSLRLADRSELPKTFPEPEKTEITNLSTVIESAEARHPELKRLKIQMDQTQIELKIAQNQMLPRLDFQLGVSQDLGTAMSPTSPTAYSLLPLANYPTEMKVSLVLEIPLFFRTARGKIEATQAAYSKIDAQETLARQKIQTTITDALQAMEVSGKRASLARKELELAHRLEEGERIRFQHGDSTLLLVNIREQNSGDAAVREVDALAEHFRAKADYHAAIVQ